MMWNSDWRFVRMAQLLWPDDVRLAFGRSKGHAAARRRMQGRAEGWHGLKALAERHSEFGRVLAEMRGELP